MVKGLKFVPTTAFPYRNKENCPLETSKGICVHFGTLVSILFLVLFGSGRSFLLISLTFSRFFHPRRSGNDAEIRGDTEENDVLFTR